MAEFDSVIPPGGQGKVTASIDSSRFKGRISKSVTLYSNDPEAERTILSLSAEILVPVDVQPRDRLVMRGKPKDMEPQVLDIVETEGNSFDILGVEKRLDDLKVEILPAPDKQVGKDGKPLPKDGKKPKLNKDAVASGYSAYQMTVTVAADAKPGNLADRIRLTTNHPKMPTIDISVSGKVEGNVTVQPERLFFLSRNGTATTRQEVRVQRRPEGGLEIKKISSSDPSFQVKLVPVAEGREYMIEVTRKEEDAATPAQARLVIETNDPLQPTIEIPMTAR